MSHCHHASGRLPSRRACPPRPEPRHLHFPFRNGTTPPFPILLDAHSRLETVAPLNSTGRHQLISSAASASRPPHYIKCPRAPHLSTASNPTPNSRSLCSKHFPVEKLWPPPWSTIAQTKRATPVPTNAVVRIPSVSSSSRCSHGERPIPKSPASHIRGVRRPAVVVGPSWTRRNFGPRIHALGPPLIAF
jgi:hypothetical protein